MYLNECFFPTCVERFVCHSETIELIESVNEFNTVTSVRDLQSRSEQRHLLVCETESARRSCWLTVHFVPDRSAAEINWHRHTLFFLYKTSCVLKLLSLRILPPLKRYTIQHSTVVEWIYSKECHSRADAPVGWIVKDLHREWGILCERHRQIHSFASSVGTFFVILLFAFEKL